MKDINVINNNFSIQYYYKTEETLITAEFNKFTKEFLFNCTQYNLLKNFKNYIVDSCFKILIGPKFIAQEKDDVWVNINRPSLEKKYFFSHDVENIEYKNQNIIMEIIYLILNDCRKQKLIQFDTDKDIRRIISENLNLDWYPYPG